MIIGNLSHIPYGSFAAALSPVAAIGLVLTIILVALFNPREYWTRKRLGEPTLASHYHGWLVAKSVLVTISMIVLFFVSQPVAKVAIVSGALLLLTRRVEAKKVYEEIDGPLLLMFAGLFVVVAGVERNVLTPEVIANVERPHLENTAILSAITAVLSNLVSNVPAVLALKPFIVPLADPQRAWLVIRHGFDPGGQLHAARVGGQFDRGPARRGRRHRDQLLELFPDRRSADNRDDRHRRSPPVTNRCRPRWGMRYDRISAD
jgi:Na+/H+ antiporter NhaD/arsenite permease-like protein